MNHPQFSEAIGPLANGWATGLFLEENIKRLIQWSIGQTMGGVFA